MSLVKISKQFAFWANLSTILVLFSYISQGEAMSFDDKTRFMKKMETIDSAGKLHKAKMASIIYDLVQEKVSSKSVEEGSVESVNIGIEQLSNINNEIAELKDNAVNHLSIEELSELRDAVSELKEQVSELHTKIAKKKIAKKKTVQAKNI